MWDIDGRDKKVKLELERLAKRRKRDEGSRGCRVLIGTWYLGYWRNFLPMGRGRAGAVHFEFYYS